MKRLRGRENPPNVLTVKDRVDVEGPCVKEGRLQAVSGGGGGLHRQGEELPDL